MYRDLKNEMMFCLKLFVYLFVLFLLLPLPVLAAGDEVKLNQLISKSPAGTIKLEARTYNIENPVILKSGVNLIGVSGKTKFLLKAGVPWGTFVPVVDGVNVKTSRIAYITFDMNGDKQTRPYGQGYHNGIFLKGCSNIEVDHCTFINGKGDGARFKTCSNLKIHDNVISRQGHDGIFVVDCKDVNIYNNRITTRTNSGIRNWNSQNVIINKNTIDAQQDGKGGYAGIQIEYSKYFENPNVVITNNVMKKTQGPGVQLIAYSAGANIKKGITISKNQFISTGVSTFISDTGGISFKGLKGATITNNVGDGCYNSFIWVASGGTGSIIKNNIIVNTVPHMKLSQSGTGYGISNRAGSSFLVDYNCFWNNKKGNTYKVTALHSTFKSPFIYKIGYGFYWTGVKWG